MNKILIVDDHKIFRESFIALLAKVNPTPAEYFEAENGLEALFILDNHKIDVVFLDIGMPILNGYEACLRIMEHPPHPSIIILTQHDDASLISRLLGLGVSFLHKDCSPHDIISSLNALDRGKQFIQPGFEALAS